jgi:methylase of polypeptide subunit release factors/pyrimidine deaminase RibD-like protein/beta-phosphoglucomutase-like phosphatase (HAD superfamily)
MRIVTVTSIPAAAIKRCDLRKTIATVTLACFLVSSVGGQGLAFIAREKGHAVPVGSALENAGIPSTLGRVTETYDAGSAKTVVVIQDLHCHGEVQKNISQLLGILDEKYRISRVYQEGVAGNVDTSWLTSFKDRKLGAELVGALLERGELTGAEYYAVSSGRHDLIAGLENDALYNANVLRLDRVTAKQAETQAGMDVLKSRYARLKKTYYGSQNLRLEKTVQAYRNGRIDARKYYGILRKYGEKVRVDIYSYENIVRYLAVTDCEKELDYPAIARELQRFLGTLKQQLPYKDYRALLDRTGNFSRVNELYRSLGEIIRTYGLAGTLAGDFPHLAAFFAYLDASQNIHPLVLIKEEKKLLKELQAGIAGNNSEREVVFLGGFLKMLEDYLSNKITADEYACFAENLPRFRFLWGKYASTDDLAPLNEQCNVMAEYYRDNLERNRWFVKNTLGDIPEGKAEHKTGQLRDGRQLLESAKGLSVAVMGGFHTAGYTELLKERNVSYIVVTPNVTQDTASSEKVYRGMMELQAQVLGQALAVRALSADPFDIKAQKVAAASLTLLLKEGMGKDEITDRINSELEDMASRFTLYGQDARGNYRFEIAGENKKTIFYYDADSGRERAAGTVHAAQGKSILAGLRRQLRQAIKDFEADVWVSHEDAGVSVEEDKQFMREALTEAKKAAEERHFFSARVGAVIVKDGMIIGRGYNDPAGIFHAEQLAVIDALRSGIKRSDLEQTRQGRLENRLDALVARSKVFRGDDEAREKFFQDASNELAAIDRELGEKGSLENTTVYSTNEPCRKCAAMINALKFGRVVFGMQAVAPSSRGITVFRDPGIKLTGGVLASDIGRLNRGYRFGAGRLPRGYQAMQSVTRKTLQLSSLLRGRKEADTDTEGSEEQQTKRYSTLGVRPGDALKAATAFNPLLGQYLRQPTVALVDTLVTARALGREEFGDIVSEKIKRQLHKALAQRANELGFGKNDKVDIKTFTLLPKELADREANILATMGIETVKAPSGDRHTVLFTQHTALKDFIADSIRNNSPPPGFRSVDAFTRAVAEHEVEEHLALRVPGSSIGRQFSRYLAAEVLKLDISVIPPDELPSRVEEARDSGRFHEFIKYAAGLPSAEVAFNARQQRRLLLVPEKIVEEYSRKLTAAVDSVVELLPGIFGNARHEFELDRSKPLVAVFDAHGTLLKPMWKDEYAVAYQRLTKKSYAEAREWVKENALFVSEDEIIRLLAKAAGVDEEEARRQRAIAGDFIRESWTPEAMEGALELIRALHKQGVTIVVTSGSKRGLVIKQLKKSGFLNIISEEMVIGLDDIILSTPQLRKSKHQYRNLVLESLRRHFPGYAFIYFNDSADGFAAARKAGGVTVGVPQGEDEEFRHNMQELLSAGADIVLDGWKHWQGLLDHLRISASVQKKKGKEKIPVFEELSTEVPVVIPARWKKGTALHIEVSDDLKTLTYSEVNDKGVYRTDGSADYTELKTAPYMPDPFPSSYLLSPERYMREHFKGKAKELLDRVWSRGRRYTTYRGITVSWDREIDKDVWTTNIDTLYLHRTLEDSGLLGNKNIKRVIEIGTGGGHISSMLAARVANLEEITITDISLYALRAAKRNIISYIKKRPGRSVRLRAYLGKGVGTIKGGKADLIVVNPPYIPAPDKENDPHTDPYRGTGLIRELLDIGLEKLNPKNLDASLILNISSMADRDLQGYFAELGDRFTVDIIGEPLKVPLKITAVNDSWKKWLVDNGLLEDRGEVAADEERFWHTLTIYRITPKPGVVKSWSAKKKDRIKEQIYTDTQAMIDTFAPLVSEQKDEKKEKELESLFPEVYGYLSQNPEDMNFDYQAAPEKNGRNLSMTRHIFERGFGKKLLGLEKKDMQLFQGEPGISQQEFERLSGIVRSLNERDLLPYIRAAFLYHDIAKARPEKLWKEWETIPGIDLRLPNKAAGLILRNKKSLSGYRKGLFENIDLFDSDVLNELFYRLIETRGNAGQWIRGETTYDVFEDFTKWIQDHLNEFAPALSARTPAEAAARLTEIAYLFNVLDAASTREGLLTSRLNGEFLSFFDDFRRVITPVDGEYKITWDGIFEKKWGRLENMSSKAKKAYIKDRIGRFRQERRDQGESAGEVDRVIDSLATEEAIDKLLEGLRHFQGWYVESATFGLSAETQIKIIALAITLAEKKGVDIRQPFHINFFNFMHALSTGRHQFDYYKTRIVEAVMKESSLEEILLDPATVEKLYRKKLPGDNLPMLGATDVTVMEGRDSIPFDFHFSEEAISLLKLLHFYEKRNLVQFHSERKNLLDLYDIRRDDLDRPDEKEYLGNMAQSKNDKLRLLKYGKGAVWVEVGPGDGRTLMDIAGTFRKAKGIQRIIGVELSDEVFKELQRVIKEKGLPVEAIKGDASQLASILKREHIPAPSTIIFCSMLHEVFSYTVKDKRQFNIDSVKDLMKSALTALEPGGRILIRDGVIPDDGEEMQVLELIGENNWQAYKYYVENFKGRDLSYAPAILHKDDEDSDKKVWRVHIKRKDAMEFLYTLTWSYKTKDGKEVFDPSSLPYEVREQYGVLTRGAYVAMLKDVGDKLGFEVQEVSLPDDERSYRQKGYEDHLRGQARLLDKTGKKKVDLPPSNMMIVVEKGKPLSGNEQTKAEQNLTMASSSDFGSYVTGVMEFSDPAFVSRIFGVSELSELSDDAQLIEDRLKEQGLDKRLSALFTLVARKVKKGELDAEEISFLRYNVDHTIRVYAALLQLYNLTYTPDKQKQIRLARLYSTTQGGEKSHEIINKLRTILSAEDEPYSEREFRKWALITLFHDVGKYEEYQNLSEAFHEEISAELLESSGILKTLESTMSRTDIREIYWVIRTHLTVGTQAPASAPITLFNKILRMKGFSDDFLVEDRINTEKFNRLLDAALLFWIFDASGINKEGVANTPAYEYLNAIIEKMHAFPGVMSDDYERKIDELAKNTSEARMEQLFKVQGKGISWKEFKDTAVSLIQGNRIEGIGYEDWKRFYGEFYHVAQWWRSFDMVFEPFSQGDAETSIKGFLLLTRAAVDPAFGTPVDEIRTMKENGFMPASPADQKEYGGYLTEVIRQAKGIALQGNKIYFTGADGSILPGVEITKRITTADNRLDVRIMKSDSTAVPQDVRSDRAPALTVALQRTATAAVDSVDPLRSFAGKLLQRISAVSADAWLHLPFDPLPELEGRTIFRYIPLQSAARQGVDREKEYEDYFREAAALKRSGNDTVMLLPVVPDGFKAVGSKIEIDRGEGKLAHAYAGRIEVDGRHVGIIAIDGMTGKDMFEFMAWLDEQPDDIRKELARHLGISGKLQGPFMAEMKGTQQDLETWLDDAALERLNMMPAERRPHMIYRGELAVAKTPSDKKRLAAIDSIVDERKYGYLTEAQRIQNLLTDVYQPAAIRDRRKMQLPTVARGTLVGVSMIRGSDRRRDSGIGELTHIGDYYGKQLKNEGQQSLLLLPVAAPKENSPFENIDMRAGDELLVDLSAAGEVQRLLKTGEISPDEIYGGDRDRVDREDVFKRKFSLMLKLRPFIANEAEGNGAYKAFLAREAEWLDDYAQARAAEWSRKNTGVPAQDAVAIFKYMQWLFDRQFREAVGNVHLQDGQMQVWVDIGQDNYEEALGAVERYLDYGLDDIVVRFTDAAALKVDSLERIKTAVAEHNPYATVAVRRPENAVLSAEVLKLLDNFKRVVYFSEAALGEPVTGNDIVIMDPPESEVRPHAGATGNIKTLYLSLLEKVRSAGAIVFTLGDLEGDDMTIANGGQWDYRMPVDGEVREKRGRSDMKGFGREVAELLRSFDQDSRKQYHARGVAAGESIAADILADDNEMAILREPLLSRPLRLKDASRRTVASFEGNGLFAVLDAYRWMKAAGEQGAEALKIHSADEDISLFSMAASFLKELADREGPNRKYWVAVLNEGRNLELHRDRTGDIEEKMRYSEELAGMLEGVAGKVLENRDVRTNGVPDTKADRQTRTALLKAAESIIAVTRDSGDNKIIKAGINGNPLYGTERAGKGLEAIRVLLSFNRYPEARAAIMATAEDLQRKGTDRRYAAMRDLLEFTALLGIYARNMGELPESAERIVEKRLGEFPRDGDGLLIVGTDEKPVEIEALYYNALKVAGDTAAAARVKKAIAKNYRDLWTLRPEENEGITSDALYLLSLNDAADLVPAEGKRRLLDSIDLKLKGPLGIRNSVNDPVSHIGLIGRYADALRNVLLSEGESSDPAVLWKLRVEMRKLINPLLAVYLEKGIIPSDEQGLSDPLTIAELYRIFDALYNPGIPSLLDPSKALKGALDTFDTRYIGRIRSAA